MTTPRQQQQHFNLVTTWSITLFWCCCYLTNTGITFCFAADFNDQLMPRITEQMDNYFDEPVGLVKSLVDYHMIGGFSSGANRTTILNLLYTLRTDFPKLVSIYMDDGSRVSWDQNGEGITVIDYNEPGFSGYDSTNIQPNDTNYKHWISCFDNTNGVPQNCSLGVGSQYVECVNDCELIPCPKSSENNETQTQTQTQTQSSNETETFLCRNRAIKEVLDGEEKGYIPALYQCMNQYGQPEQRPGFVLTNYTTTELGNCYYGDKETLVNSTLIGDYGACGGDGIVCDNAYHGAYNQDTYDQRYRPFYQDMMAQQHPLWREPFFYYNFPNTLAISYLYPIYSSLEQSNNKTTTTVTTTTTTTNNNNVKVFEGIITCDYHLQYITNFLREEYSDSEVSVLVVENNAPHYIIASSINNDYGKTVLTSDPNKPCPAKYFDTDNVFDSDMCQLDRMPITDLKDSKDDSDVILYRAFSAQQNMNFPVNSNVNMKQSDGIGSPAFVTQSQLYQLPGSENSKTLWHVVAIMPMSRSTNDSAMPGDTSFIIICFVGSLGFLGCLALFVKFFSQRYERAMINADWRFTCAFILGCTALNLSSFTLLGENSNQTCMLRMWSFNGLFACALSPLFVKVWRMAILLKASRGFKRNTVTNFMAFLYTLPLVALQLLILLTFSLLDPPRQTEELGVGDGIGVQRITCDHRTNAFYITQVTFDGCLIFAGCILAYRTRDLDPKFGEAKQLGFSMYNIAFTGIVTLATASMVALDQESRMILQAVGVLWASFFSSFAFVLPRLLQVRKERESVLCHVSRSSRFISELSQSEWGKQRQSGILRPETTDSAQFHLSTLQEEIEGRSCNPSKVDSNVETSSKIIRDESAVEKVVVDSLADKLSKENATSETSNDISLSAPVDRTSTNDNISRTDQSNGSNPMVSEGQYSTKVLEFFEILEEQH